MKDRFVSKCLVLVMILSLCGVAEAQHTTSETERVSTCTLADYITAHNTNYDVGDCEVSVHEMEFHNNSASEDGGAIVNAHGVLQVRDSVFSQNSRALPAAPFIASAMTACFRS